MRLARLIIENIRKKAGKALAVICRINASDDVLGGQTPQDAAAVASYLEKECGVDALHVSRAVHLHDEYMWAPSALHEGFSANCVTETYSGDYGRTLYRASVCRTDGGGRKSGFGCFWTPEHCRP